MNTEKRIQIAVWLVIAAGIGSCSLYVLKDSKDDRAKAEQKRRSAEQRAQVALNDPPKVREWQLQGGTMREIIMPVAGFGSITRLKTCYVWIDANKFAAMSCDQDTSFEAHGIERPDGNVTPY